MKKFLSQEDLEKLLNDDSQEEVEVQTVVGESLSASCFLITIKDKAVGIDQSNKIFNKIYGLINDVEKHIIIDLSNCPYLSSYTIGRITKLAIDRDKRGLRLALVGANKVVQDVLELTSLSQIIETYSTADGAVHAFSQSEIDPNLFLGNGI